jgi:hypothetical protein
MILRAIFWIGLVAVFMPHEPDLGFGRPAGKAGVPDAVAEWTRDKVENDLGGTANFCRDNTSACAVSMTLLDEVKAMTLRNLAQVKADLAQSDARRGSGS